jgi:hypothetical protein
LWTTPSILLPKPYPGPSVKSVLGMMFTSSMDAIRAKFAGSQNMSLLAGAALLAVLPFDVEHLLLMLLGGGAYYALHKMQPRVAPASQKKTQAGLPPWRAASASGGTGSSLPKERKCGNHTVKSQCQELPHSMSPLKKTLSAVPVAAPVFHSLGWEAEVAELIAQIAPTHRCEKTVERIASLVKRVLEPVFPGAEVASFVCGNIDSGKAFGVAVPEVDVVVNVSPTAVARRMLSRDQVNATKKVAGLDARSLQKYAIRLCTERLVASSGLKFRRSAFRGDEPKVTFLAPTTLGFSENSVPLDLSVNSSVPFYNAALLTECGQLEPRTKALILLVRRWAKDRGICHASKGHFQPYVWTLLTIYFLQVGMGEEPLLPPVEDFKLSSDLMTGAGAPKSQRAKAQYIEEKTSVGSLLKRFFRFYADFSWRDEAVAVKSGKRAAPASSLPLHIVVHSDGKGSEVGPTIEDPFTHGRNLGTCLTTVSLDRLKEELMRADALCMKDASLSLLLAPWAPTEYEPESAA